MAKAHKYKPRKDGRYSTTVKYNGSDNIPKIKTIYGKTEKELLENKKTFEMTMHIYKYEEKNVLFKEYAELWLENKKHEVSYNTYRMYDTIFRNHLTFFYNMYIPNINRMTIQRMINEINHKRRTCEQVIIMLKQIFETALDDELIHRNPCRKIVLPKKKPTEKRALADFEIRLSLVSDFNDKQSMYIKLLLYCGLRKQEALALSVDKFDFKRNLIFINQGIYYKNNEAYLKETKTSKSNRAVPFPPSCSAFFEWYINNLEGKFLFTNETNKKLFTSSAYKSFWRSIKCKMNAKAKELGLPEVNISAHLYRHNFATMMHTSGVDDKTIQTIIGHSSIITTKDIYTHIDENNYDLTNVYANFDNF